MLISSPHNLNLCSDSQDTRFLWNVFEAVQKTRSTCFIGFKNTRLRLVFLNPIKHCCSCFKQYFINLKIVRLVLNVKCEIVVHAVFTSVIVLTVINQNIVHRFAYIYMPTSNEITNIEKIYLEKHRQVLALHNRNLPEVFPGKKELNSSGKINVSSVQWKS